MTLLPPANGLPVTTHHCLQQAVIKFNDHVHMSPLLFLSVLWCMAYISTTSSFWIATFQHLQGTVFDQAD
jgi:hypothetical protein